MIRALLAFPLLAATAAVAAPDPGAEPAEFEAAQERFADAAACRTHLSGLVTRARADGFDAAEGPYELTEGDVRAHTVRAEGAGHRIAEYRCEEARLSARSWTHSMAAEEEEFTVESVARRAEWLKQGRSEQ